MDSTTERKNASRSGQIRFRHIQSSRPGDHLNSGRRDHRSGSHISGKAFGLAFQVAPTGHSERGSLQGFGGMNIKIVVVASLLCAGCTADDPFQTFYSPGWHNTISPMPAYSGPPLAPATVDPPVQYVQFISLEQVKSVARLLAAQGYRRIGISVFESNWPVPHNEGAAQMGRKLGADLVTYVVVGAGTRLQSVPDL